MSKSKKIFFVLIITLSTSGCFLPMPAGLLIAPISHLARAYMFEKPTEQTEPVSVSKMLAKARGEVSAESPSDKTIDDEPKSAPQLGSITVAELLKNAHVTDTKTEKKEPTTPVEIKIDLSKINSPQSAAAILKQKFEPNIQLRTRFGTGESPIDRREIYKYFFTMRSICRELNSRCHQDDLMVDPNLSQGFVIFSARQG